MINKYIIFNTLPSELSNTHEINTKYHLHNEDDKFYYLNNCLIEKERQDQNYTIGFIQKPKWKD
jgi:hypothetical protein